MARALPVYLALAICFGPALVRLIMATAVLAIPLAIDLSKGHYDAIPFILALIGGWFGILSVTIFTICLMNSQDASRFLRLVRLGIACGIASTVWAYINFPPVLTTAIFTDLLPILAGIFLLSLTFSKAANKRMQTDQMSATRPFGR